MADVYDDEIAPLLMQAAKLAEANGLPFVAFVALADGDSGRTVALPKDSPFSARLVHLAAQANGNVDSMMLSLIRHAREAGPGNSIFLHRELVATPASGGPRDG